MFTINDITREKLEEHRDKGLSIGKIAKIYNETHWHIWKLSQKFKVQFPRKRLIDLTGRVISGIEFLEYAYSSKNNGAFWKCKCHCGNIKIMCGSAIRKLQTKSCGCVHYKKGPKSFAWKGGKYISKAKLNSIKSNCKRGREVPLKLEVTLDFLETLYEKQNKKSALSGRSISFADKTASLDRIDSSGDYTKDNVQWVHKDENRLKFNWEQEELINLCSHIGAYSRYGLSLEELDKIMVEKGIYPKII